jgi:glycosyltransferase involved in cell wall biosynthesis
MPVAVVIPCYNEEDALPHLAATLKAVRTSLQPRYAPTFIFVNDGSTDNTAILLQELFGPCPDCEVTHLPQNIGIAGAILAGIRQTKAEVVCSIDSDCSYDPRELASMIPLLHENVHVVTASPYHPNGGVLDVSSWRLWLSRTASAMYRRVLHHKLATYTSCFRVYRRCAVADLPITDSRFAGVAEILGRLDLLGAHIVEYPTTLRARTSGQSKMKLCRTVFAQLAVLVRLICIRWFHPSVSSLRITSVTSVATVIEANPHQKHQEQTF